jgi:hypothetical protein
VPDAGAGEGLNIGVIVYSEEARFLRLQVDSRYERLSRAFAKFDGPGFRHAVANLVVVFRAAEKHFADKPLFVGDRSFSEWLRALVPDTGASMSFTPPRHGITSDLGAETEALFDRMVESQKGQVEETPRRDDAQVWRSYAEKIPLAASKHITTKSFDTASVKVEFEHAVKNGAWHVIQPLSMDYKQAESMQRKASQWVGTTVGLKGVPDLGTVFFLIGQPSFGHPKAYGRAKALLSQAPVKHEIIEEHDAEKFGRQLLDLIEHQR